MKLHNTYVMGVVWKDPDAEKAYWYGPLHGEDEKWVGEVVLRALWADKFKEGLVEIQTQMIGEFPWQEDPTSERRWGTSIRFVGEKK